MGWFKRTPRQTATELEQLRQEALKAVIQSREALAATERLHDRVDTVTSSLHEEMYRNHFVDRMEEAYGKVFAARGEQS